MPLPPATIRTQVPLPLCFSNGYESLARVFSFDGLVDGREHIAFGLGDRAATVTSTENLRPPAGVKSAPHGRTSRSA
jgi:GTP cyclohydrolase II